MIDRSASPGEPDVSLHSRLSVVIPNLDGERWLEGCLGSLSAGTVKPFEVIVADDGSSDTSRDITERFAATWIDAPRARSGFAATANRGLRVASGEWVLLLNNDTEVDPATVEMLRAAFDRYPDVAMIAPLVLSLRDRQTIDSAGMLLFPDATARPRWHGEAASSVRLQEEDVLVPSGAAAVFRRDWLLRVGLLDEGMTSYLEDIDLGLRIRRAGGHAVFVPSAVVYHWFSGTMGALSPVKARLIERNHVTVAARHLPPSLLLGLPIWTALRWVALVRTVVRARDTASGIQAPATGLVALSLARGTVEGLVRLPRALGERRAARSKHVIAAGEWRRLLHAHRARLADYRRFGAGEE